MGLARSTKRYEALIEPEEQRVRKRLRELAHRYRRYGSPRLHILLAREGLVKNHKRTERLYREEGLTLRRRRPKRKTRTFRVPLTPVIQRNERWSMDFVHDSLVGGRRFRCLTIVDNFSKESPAIEVDTSLTGLRVVRVLERLKETHGLPKALRVDNGPEFISISLQLWALENGVELEFIQPGKPIENAFIESFNGKFRDECLNEHCFLNLKDAQKIIEDWRRQYNEIRPHSSLGGLSPKEFIEKNNPMIAA